MPNPFVNRRVTRREFLRYAEIVGFGALAAPVLAACAQTAPAPAAEAPAAAPAAPAEEGVTVQAGLKDIAREKTFSVEASNQKSASFLLASDEDTLAVFPFHFEFRVLYELRKATLNVTYEITNDSDEELFFSVGGHPAFALPLVEGTEYSDYYLEFEQKETAPRWPISASAPATGWRPVRWAAAAARTRPGTCSCCWR